MKLHIHSPCLHGIVFNYKLFGRTWALRWRKRVTTVSAAIGSGTHKVRAFSVLLNRKTNVQIELSPVAGELFTKLLFH